MSWHNFRSDSGLGSGLGSGLFSSNLAIMLRGSDLVDKSALKIVSQELRNVHLNCTQIARKAAPQESPCPLCPPWLNTIFTPAHGRAPPLPAPAVRPLMSGAGDKRGRVLQEAKVKK